MNLVIETSRLAARDIEDIRLFAFEFGLSRDLRVTYDSDTYSLIVHLQTDDGSMRWGDVRRKIVTHAENEDDDYTMDEGIISIRDYEVQKMGPEAVIILPLDNYIDMYSKFVPVDDLLQAISYATRMRIF